MGLFSFRKPPARVNSSGSVPHTADLLYPAVLPAFSEIAAGEHRDPRAVFYTIRFMDPQRSRPFTPDVLDASDFGSKAEVRRVLVRRGFVQNADAMMIGIPPCLCRPFHPTFTMKFAMLHVDYFKFFVKLQKYFKWHQMTLLEIWICQTI